VDIQFALPGVEQTFRCKARVAWVRAFRSGAFKTPGFGLQFVDLPGEEADFIEAWVRARVD
jgi:hypothetical protein